MITQEKIIDNLNSLTAITEIKYVTKNFPIKKQPGPDGAWHGLTINEYL